MRIKIFLLTALLSLAGYAQETPKWIKKARNAIFSIVTYDSEDKILRTGNGFFISEEGEALSDYSTFKGAERAVIVTSTGKQFPVTQILGADDMYDIVKFRTDTGKEKLTVLPLAEKAATTGEGVWLLPYSTQKEVTVPYGKVEEVVSAATDYHYYTLRMSITDKMVSCPVTNNAGEVIALVQQSSDNESKVSYAIDARMGTQLKIGALTANSAALRSIGIRKALPATEDEALVYLYMKSGREEPSAYLDLLNEFITVYPGSAEGYRRRAELYAQSFKDSIHYDLAEKDIAQALELSERKDEIHFALCRMIYTNSTSAQPFDYKDWNLTRSLDECRKAIAADSLPLYLQTEAELLFALRRYGESHRAYMQVNQTNMATATTWYAAARSLALSGDTLAATPDSLLFLYDKAVNCYARPYPQEAALYLWERAQAYANAGKPREAVMDYNEYYTLMGNNVNGYFYYQRSQAALAGRMNQLALDDLKQACEAEPTNADYLAELGSLHARFNQPDEAIAACERALSLAPDYAACHRIIAICHNLKGNKAKTAEHLQKAKSLGDPQADALMEKYCK